MRPCQKSIDSLSIVFHILVFDPVRFNWQWKLCVSSSSSLLMLSLPLLLRTHHTLLYAHTCKHSLARTHTKAQAQAVHVHTNTNAYTRNRQNNANNKEAKWLAVSLYSIVVVNGLLQIKTPNQRGHWNQFWFFFEKTNFAFQTKFQHFDFRRKGWVQKEIGIINRFRTSWEARIRRTGERTKKQHTKNEEQTGISQRLVDTQIVSSWREIDLVFYSI